jgi:hypothetical protein
LTHYIEQLEQAHREAAAAGLDDHAARALVNLAGLSLSSATSTAPEP